MNRFENMYTNLADYKIDSEDFIIFEAHQDFVSFPSVFN